MRITRVQSLRISAKTLPTLELQLIHRVGILLSTISDHRRHSFILMAFQFYTSKVLGGGQEILEQLGAQVGGNSLVVQGGSVKWYAHGGIQLVKHLSFQLKPLDVKFFHFSGGQGVAGVAPATKLALAVLLPNDDVHVCLASGETHDIHLPCPVRAMIALSQGLLFQRDAYSTEMRMQFLLLSNPLAPFTAVRYHERYIPLLDTFGEV
jgi:hypothetical protein